MKYPKVGLRMISGESSVGQNTVDYYSSFLDIFTF